MEMLFHPSGRLQFTWVWCPVRPSSRRSPARFQCVGKRQERGPSYEVNETLWQVVDSAALSRGTFADCYRELADQLVLPGKYWDRLRTAMGVWADLSAPYVEGRKVGPATVAQGAGA